MQPPSSNAQSASLDDISGPLLPKGKHRTLRGPLGYALNLFNRIHSWLSTAPSGLSMEAADVFAVTNYAMVLGLGCHALFCALFFALGLDTLAFVNIGSVMIFVVGVALAKVGRLNSSLFVGSLEVLGHAWLATVLLGWNAGFHYHIILLVVLIFLFTGIPVIVRALLGALVVTSYLALAYYARVWTPHSLVSEATYQLLSSLNIVIFMVGLAGICGYYTHTVRVAREALAREFDRSERLLYNILPQPIATRLKADTNNIADGFDECSVLFCDIVGFTQLSQKLAPNELVHVLNQIFTAFDALAERHQVEKIKTIGDAYMVASGIPMRRFDHADAIAYMALGMRSYMEEFRERTPYPLSVRIGIHSGPAVAGVIGQKKFIYDLWGDTVNTAARMESHGLANEIQVTETTYEILSEEFEFESRGVQDVKGKGPMRTFILKDTQRQTSSVHALRRLPTQPHLSA
ncbi:MAG: adenylate/guanylate cyclase domain-containing protein [Myxococcota bacterium]|nr:adenylate/guanylate cyclase domain-containing protein [Myxococcota bacterium]